MLALEAMADKLRLIRLWIGCVMCLRWSIWLVCLMNCLRLCLISKQPMSCIVAPWPWFNIIGYSCLEAGG